jgi:hypothetical protein
MSTLETGKVMSRTSRANTIAGVLILVALLALAVLWAGSPLSPDAAMADGPSPHITTDATTDSALPPPHPPGN